MTTPSTKVPTAREAAHALCLARRPIPLCIDNPRLVEASGHSKACDFALAAIEADRAARDVRERELRHMAAQLNEAHRLLRNWLVEGRLAKLPVPMLMTDTEEELASTCVKQAPQREEWPTHCGQPARPAKDVPGFVCMECSAVFQVRKGRG